MQIKKLHGIITLIRHGEKSTDGTLTEKGELQVLAKAIQTKYLGGQILVYHSGVDRVKRTVDIVRNFLMFSEDDLLSHSLQELLQSERQQSLSEAPQQNLHYLEQSTLPSNYYATWDERVHADQQSTLTAFLQMKEESPEPGIVLPPKKLAQRVCQLLREQIDIIQSSAEPVNIINGTHEPVLLSLVSYFVNAWGNPDPDFLQALGGSIRFAESADIEIYQPNNSDEYVFRFRNFTISFTSTDLLHFIQDTK